ncbi:PQQ-binding-like beta-propeller repeat protein [Streptomyces naganishii]|uniref:PQQ-binding-like beta-propeller repeat protein n=1 Tax=Streptomyces naganishii TaxID=285447 RepID=UPI00227D7DE3|nr:PQQ-binding-like beta-propeller repeat protein [Streptomyces naganishii]
MSSGTPSCPTRNGGGSSPRGWTTRTTNDSSPAVSGGLVYVGARASDSTERLCALDARTGRLRWAFRTRGRAGSPVVSGGTVCVADEVSYLYALDAATGRRRWTFATGDQVETAPAVSGGTVLVGGDDRRLYALDAATGRKRWEFSAGAAVNVSPAVSGDVVCAGVGRNPGILYGVDLATGRQHWKSTFGSGIASAGLTVAGGLVLLGVDGRLFAMDAGSGRRRWKCDMGKGGVNSRSVPAGSGSVAYVSGYGGVYAVDAKGT